MDLNGEKNAITYPMQSRSVWMNIIVLVNPIFESASVLVDPLQLALVVDWSDPLG